MTICRSLLAIALVGLTIPHAGAQSDSTPGTRSDGPPGSGSAPSEVPPLHCQQLLTLRDKLQKHGAAISEANTKKADVRVACRLFRIYIATEAKMLKLLDASGPSCGVPKEVNQQVRGSHAKAQRMGQQVCDAAQRPPYRPHPPLDDDIIRPFRLNPELKPKPWPGAYTARGTLRAD